MKINGNDKKMMKETNKEYNNLPESVQGFLSDRILLKISHLVSMIEDCESPIEQLMGIALAELLPGLDQITEANYLIAQYPIDSNDKSYRVDFLLDCFGNNKNVSCVVECDGHDYHEKTKEQAKRDKQRDRNLTKDGHKVIRFTGSEIYKNPMHCAREVINIIKEELSAGSDLIGS